MDNPINYWYQKYIALKAKVDEMREKAVNERWDELQTNFREINEAFEAGKAEQKKRMMEEAVEGEILLTPYPTICLDDCKDYDFKEGDKVRVIIVKE